MRSCVDVEVGVDVCVVVDDDGVDLAVGVDVADVWVLRLCRFTLMLMLL